MGKGTVKGAKKAGKLLGKGLILGGTAIALTAATVLKYSPLGWPYLIGKKLLKK